MIHVREIIALDPATAGKTIDGRFESIHRFGQVRAQVRWAIDGSAGARFLAENDL